METLLLKKENNTLYIKLNRPEFRNALNKKMIRELTEAFQSITPNDPTHSVVLSGHGLSFCAGADLDWMKNSLEFSFEDAVKDSTQLFDLLNAMKNCPRLLIGLAHGHVMGGGLGLLSTCDIVLAENETQFSFSEVRLGLIPAIISPFLSYKVAAHKLFELMTTGRRFDSIEAQSMGLVHTVCSLDEFDDHLSLLLTHQNKNSLSAVKEIKDLLYQLPHLTQEQTKSLTIEKISHLRRSADAQSRISDFFSQKKDFK